ncbi:UNVERIFIED_CONTAM: Hsp20/alpha crystallin family protein [Halobacillus marinus]|uniref:Hsp20/alpha crystallin family protein n=1 Tax=Bacillaceae TaxID=186817 RepID=UPI0002A4E619|nr:MULTISPECIES: Hsp20/alpha crystallin family protein [Bacillaceae]ELK49083.1 small heat shock protein [Halobacillus sp. BAB-2008]QHT48124.1 Hsp20/alpha crystallin family protein [Bacillus sp. SB49]
MTKKKGQLNWDAFSENVEKVLGEDFWNDMHHVIPKKGPSYDFFQTKDQGVLVIELPGMTKNDHVQMTQEGTRLIVKGTVTPPYPVPVEELIHDERMKGSFKRIIPIPFPFSIDDITTAYSDGLMVITLRKHADSNEVRIHFDPQ